MNVDIQKIASILTVVKNIMEQRYQFSDPPPLNSSWIGDSYMRLQTGSSSMPTIPHINAGHWKSFQQFLLQYYPRNMHTVFALLCFVVVIHWLVFPYPSGLLLTIAPVPAKQPWWIWINISCEFIMNDCITTTKQSTTKPCAYFLGYTVRVIIMHSNNILDLHKAESQPI